MGNTENVTLQIYHYAIKRWLKYKQKQIWEKSDTVLDQTSLKIFSNPWTLKVKIYLETFSEYTKFLWEKYQHPAKKEAFELLPSNN